MPDPTCAQCGHPLPPDGQFCMKCGAVFVRPPAAVPIAPSIAQPPASSRVAPPPASVNLTLVEARAPKPMGQSSQATMFGYAAPSGPSVRPARSDDAPASVAPPARTGAAKTIVLAPPVHEPASASVARPATDAAIKRTMIGIAGSVAPAMAPPAAPEPAAPSGAAAVPNFKGTMLGVAIPGIAPTQSNPPAAPTPSFRPSDELGRAAGGSTMLGVAAPGIAPLRAAATPAPAPAPRAAPVVLPRPAPLHDDEPALAPAPRVTRGGVPLAYVAGGVLGLVVLVGVAVALLWKGQSLVVVPRLDPQGHEQLHLTCDGCADGTTASLGTARAEFHDKEADLATATPLTVGDNALTITLDRPGWGRNEEVKVVVPIAFRIKADLAALAGPRPSVVVRVEAVPGSVVQVDGKPVQLDARGNGSYPIDVSAQTTGWSDERRPIDRSIAYSIVTPSTSDRKAIEQTGTLPVRAEIAPLHLDAPGPTAFIEGSTFRIHGHTVKGGTVTANGQPVPVDPDGTFARSYDAPSLGDVPVEIRADAPQFASRTARFVVKRVAHLADEARLRERAPWVAYDAILADPTGTVGKETIVEGDVFRAKSEAGQIVALVDDSRGCPGSTPCLVRVVYGGDDPLVEGARVKVFGRITRTVPADAGAAAVPEVQAEFLMKGRAGRR